MNNSYYDQYAQPYCKMPRQTYDHGVMNRNTVNCRYEKKHTEKNCCESRMDQPIPQNASLTMAYVPFQEKCEVYDCMNALKCGTLFPELNKPFTGCCRYE